ncbi:hypothetical protein HAX54_022863 [Datura stramonium]|uniref:Maternal effect embryo arrest 59 n=1 Tax=Datura stramonium TaxID=4076 RepID=A0ABS8UX65_DATST|nr:hypothetical protein [Datura stramonium]
MERHLTVTKPSRSDEVLDEISGCRLPTRRFPKPEAAEISDLFRQGGSIFSETNCSEQEEFVETQYYNELVSIDKQHHTTGSGFIKVANPTNGNIYNLQLNGVHENGRAREFKTNPATNDWIPSSDDYQVEFTSSKPSRSESD